MKFWVMFHFCLLNLGFAYAQCSPISSCQQAFVTNGPLAVKFLMYTPANYQAGTPAPLLVSLHGLGEIGDDLQKLIFAGFPAIPRNPAWLINQNQWPTNRPFIVVSPQLKPDGSGDNQDWSETVIDETIEYCNKNRRFTSSAYAQNRPLKYTIKRSCMQQFGPRCMHQKPVFISMKEQNHAVK